LRQEHPFTASDLLARIKKSKKLPENQKPLLLKRDEDNDNVVWLAPLNARNPACKPSAEPRDPLHEHLDIRLHFYRQVRTDDAKNVAKYLSGLVRDDNEFDVKHVAFLSKSSVFYQAAMNFRSGFEKKKRKRSSSGSTVAMSPTMVRSLRRKSSLTFEDEMKASPDEIGMIYPNSCPP
jgi:hypothetical protein